MFVLRGLFFSCARITFSRYFRFLPNKAQEGLLLADHAYTWPVYLNYKPSDHRYMVKSLPSSTLVYPGILRLQLPSSLVSNGVGQDQWTRQELYTKTSIWSSVREAWIECKRQIYATPSLSHGQPTCPLNATVTQWIAIGTWVFVQQPKPCSTNGNPVVFCLKCYLQKETCILFSLQQLRQITEIWASCTFMTSCTGPKRRFTSIHFIEIHPFTLWKCGFE